jgi:hypothetical protein
MKDRRRLATIQHKDRSMTNNTGTSPAMTFGPDGMPDGVDDERRAALEQIIEQAHYLYRNRPWTAPEEQRRRARRIIKETNRFLEHTD